MKNIKLKVLTFSYLILLTYASLKPADTSSGQSTIKQMLHNSMHMPAYTILTGLLLYNFASLNNKSRGISLAIAIGYGLLMEVLQHFSPGREASLSDVGFNAMGSLMAILITIHWTPLRGWLCQR